jgi:hypothetical protein
LIHEQAQMLTVECVAAERSSWRFAKAESSIHRAENYFRVAGFVEDERDAAGAGERARFAFEIVSRAENHPGVRDSRGGAQLPHELEAVHRRHENVSDDEVGAFSLRHP